MFACCLPNNAAPPANAVAVVARTGDIYMYATGSERAWALSDMLSATPCAVACSDGVRETPVDFDTVAVVIEREDDSTPELLVASNSGELFLVPLGSLAMRGGACMRALFTEQAGNDKQCVQRRRSIRTLLINAASDLSSCDSQLTGVDRQRINASPAYLTAYLLYRAGIVTLAPEHYCGKFDDDIDYLFGSDSQHLDDALTQPNEFGYGHQVWVTRQ